MKAVIIKEFGGPEQLTLGEWEKPSPSENEVLVKVHNTALNRADTMQRKGAYPPPPGASPILGLEIAGEVAEVGASVTQWKPGDKVFGLIPGGGYAEYAVIHQDMAMPIPAGFNFEQAAAIPEVFLTAFQAMKWLIDIQPGETLLVHAGASGVGTAAIQLAKAMGVQVIVTASAPKHQTCLDLGAALAIDYKTEDFQQKALEFTNGKGVDGIIDFIAAPYFLKNIDALATDGRMVILALMGGLNVDGFNLGKMLRKRLKVMGSTLRARTRDYQIRLTQDLKSFAIPLIEQGKIKPVIDSVFDWNQVAEAHQYMEANKNTGKIILKIS